jgi:hypothetical protein
MIELRFVNSDATPKTSTVRCDTASMAPIMAWYGAYYAGDRYAVFADGEKLTKDRNGELVSPNTPSSISETSGKDVGGGR